MCTQNEAVVILREVYEGCEAIFGSIKEAYLYGSYAIFMRNPTWISF